MANTVKVTDNTGNTVEVYRDNIYFYADEFIKTELDLTDDIKPDNKKNIADNFTAMILYISDNIDKPSNDDIELLDNIFNVYVRLCCKYHVLPTLEIFSFLVKINRTTFTDWGSGEYRVGSAHAVTVKKWFDICKSFVVNRLHNQTGTNANLIFTAKAAYGMVETAPRQVEYTPELPTYSREEIAARARSVDLLPALVEDLPD